MDSIGDSLNELKKEVLHLWKDKRNVFFLNNYNDIAFKSNN